MCFFNGTATTEIHPLSLHDALPISGPGPSTTRCSPCRWPSRCRPTRTRETRERLGFLCGGVIHALSPGLLGLRPAAPGGDRLDRKCTRLNSSHANMSYAVFCLKIKK